MSLSRRSFFTRATALLVAPSIVRISSLMPVSVWGMDIARNPDELALVRIKDGVRQTLGRFSSDLDALAGANGPDLFEKMATMLVDAHHPPPSELHFETSRMVQHWADVQAMRSRNVIWSIANRSGWPETSFRGVPLRITEYPDGPV